MARQKKVATEHEPGQEPGLVSLGGIPVEYIGKKAVKYDNVANTGLSWTPGQIHIVPPIIAARLTRHADVWREADPDAVTEDPSHVGIVLAQKDEGEQPENAAPQGEQPPQLFGLPNLQGMTQQDLATFAASQFNEQFAEGTGKDEMIARIVVLANSNVATGIDPV